MAYNASKFAPAETTVDGVKTITFSRKSDLTLVSSDGVQFLVTASMMSEASEVFEGMLTVPQPPGSTSRSVALADDAKALQLLLSWIYPQNNRPLLTFFHRLAPLLTVAKKYEVSVAVLRAMLVLPDILKANPFEIYVFCVRHNFEYEGREAIREVILQNIDMGRCPMTKRFAEDCKSVTFWQIRSLNDLRKSCYNDAVDLVRDEFTEEPIGYWWDWDNYPKDEHGDYDPDPVSIKLEWVEKFIRQFEERGVFQAVSEMLHPDFVEEFARKHSPIVPPLELETLDESIAGAKRCVWRIRSKVQSIRQKAAKGG